MPEVSVIVPNYNHAPYLRQRLDSILNQSFQDFELIILDDCSTDSSREVIESYRHHEKVSAIIYNEKNSGSTFKQWERGMAQARGKWLWIAESDDFAAPEFLEVLIREARSHNNIGISYCSSHWVDDRGIPGKDLSMYHHSFVKSGPQEVREQMLIHCTVQNASSALIRRDLAITAIRGLWRYKACGDWIFYVRLLQHADLVHTADKLNYFRWYHDNISNKASKNGLWITEGVDTLRNVRYRKAGFTKEQVYRVAALWYYKIKPLPWRKKLRASTGLFYPLSRYLALRIGLV